ncbi:MAG: short-chain dehydrogenase [Ignavibacteriales bacterium CG_4_9_14_3_um_filter_34_10]|nr:MAG: short-chain dehydrogenase [Ignavibacteriales bacterium CG_4_9_14_3_um_filter_34_10]
MNKIFLITGSTDGIGKQTACELAKTNDTVIIHGRDKKKCLSTIKWIKSKVKDAQLDFVTADLSSLDDIRKMAAEISTKFSKLDVLINNAGVYKHERELSQHGFEMTFAINHLAHFLLTNLLLPLLKNSDSARIINVSSIAHTRASMDFSNLNSENYFDGYYTYSLSKLANVLFTYELAERLSGNKITVNALHPGVISTKLLQSGFNIAGSSLKEGAATSVYLATSAEVEGVTGKYFIKSAESQSSPLSYSKEYQKKLWEASEKLVGLT